MKWRRIIFTSLLSVSWVLFAGSAKQYHAMAAEPADLLRDFGRDQLVVITASRCIRFDVYVAHNRQQRAQGLMYIRSMAMDEGMIFLYPEPVQISMWMKNTLISLDMIFVAADFSIAKIIRLTEPMSESILDSEHYVQSVLELNGGAADYFGIREGDQLIFPAAGVTN